MFWDEVHQKHKWIDNDPVSWTNWAKDQPNCMESSSLRRCSTIKNCVILSLHFYFASDDCSHQWPVLCQSGKLDENKSLRKLHSAVLLKNFIRNNNGITCMLRDPYSVCMFDKMVQIKYRLRCLK